MSTIRRKFRTVVLCVAGFAAIQGIAPGAPPVDDAGPSMTQFVKIRWPGNAELGRHGTLYYVYDPDGIRQLYELPNGFIQEQAVKLTNFKDGIGGYSLSYDAKWIGITASVGGSEQADLFLLDTKSGKQETLFSNPEVVYGGALWRRDSKAFAYRANDDSPADFHVYIYDIASRTHKKVYAGSGYHYPVDFSSDGSKLVIGKYNSASYSQLFEITLDTGATKEITPADEQWSFSGVGYLADDRTFLVNSNYRGDLKTLYAIDTVSGEIKPLVSDVSGHEVDWATLHPDRAVVAFAVNEDGYAALHMRGIPNFAPIQGLHVPKGVVGNVTFRGLEMLYSVSNANTPGIIYKWSFLQPHEPVEPITKADTQGIDVSKFRLPELVHYPSFDGKKIPAFVYLPSNYQKGTKIPFLVYYHGGPEGQFRPGFMRSFQYFLSRGYGIIAPNVRGSSGYGKAYIEADNYKNRYKSVSDGVWAAKYVIDQGYTDKKMVGAWGGSYGGFMVMATITEAPELFGAACNVVGVVNFETFLQQTKAYRRKLREAEYGPLSDPEFLRSISPIHKIDRVQTPLMLAHGLNDPRVPIGEAMQVAIALKKRGIEVEELYFPDEGHGFAKEENRLLYYEQLAKFFEKHLRK